MSSSCQVKFSEVNKANKPWTTLTHRRLGQFSFAGCHQQPAQPNAKALWSKTINAEDTISTTLHKFKWSVPYG